MIDNSIKGRIAAEWSGREVECWAHSFRGQSTVAIQICDDGSADDPDGGNIFELTLEVPQAAMLVDQLVKQIEANCPKLYQKVGQ